MKQLYFISLLLLLFSCETPTIPEEPESFLLAIQPLEQVSSDKIEVIKTGIKEQYGFRVVVLDRIAMPKNTFVNIKSPRYRADSLIRYLKANKPDSIGIIFGITEKDISTTKRDEDGAVKKPERRYTDFGIFGLGYRPGVSCVVSTFRLGKGSILDSRLKKITLHEIGHNLGLKHCENKKCLMTDAVESIRTVDNASDELCVTCRIKLGIDKN